ncbi:MAG TPA: hypothetical protein VF701_04085 [Thermoanaerobaculia bacterium]
MSYGEPEAEEDRFCLHCRVMRTSVDERLAFRAASGIGPYTRWDLMRGDVTVQATSRADEDLLPPEITTGWPRRQS